MATFHLPPYVYYEKDKSVYDGLEYKILKSVSRDWPIYYTILDGDHVYTTIKQQVATNDQYDVGFATLWFAAPIPEDIEVSLPYSQSCVTFLVPKPKPLSESTYVFQPFKSTVWLLLLALTAFMGIVLTLLLVRGNVADRTVGFVHAIRIVTQSGVRFSRQGKSLINLALLFWSVFSLLIATGYSSGLSSILAYPRYTRNIRTLRDMADNVIYWTAPDHDTVINYNISSNSLLRGFAKRFVFETDSLARWKLVRTGNVVFCHWFDCSTCKDRVCYFYFYVKQITVGFLENYLRYR